MSGKYGRAPILFRVPARWSISLTICLVFLGVDGLIAYQQFFSPYLFLLVILHSLDILTHKPLLTITPFSQSWKRPSQHYDNELLRYLGATIYRGKVSGLPYPFRSGYIANIRTLGYMGGFSLKCFQQYFRYGDNGTGAHDWHDLVPDSQDVSTYGVRYSIKKNPYQLNQRRWKQTKIKDLYENIELRKDYHSTWTNEREIDWLIRHSCNIT